MNGFVNIWWILDACNLNCMCGKNSKVSSIKDGDYTEADLQGLK